MAWFKSAYTRSLEERILGLLKDLEASRADVESLRKVNGELNQKVFDLRIAAASKAPEITAGEILKKQRPAGGNWLKGKAALESAQCEIVENPEREN